MNEPNHMGEGRVMRTETAIACALRIGVWVSATLIAFGLVLSWIVPHPTGFAPEDLSYILTQGTPEPAPVPHTFPQFALGLSILDPGTVIALGLLVLISLPMIRVGLAFILFVLERDYVYIAISLFVFAALISGLLLGKAL
ncbi:MAG: DUF1634 domain-containing protein [Methylotenera sp.]|nr:DUF1634 domain-containing protein [Oligoflexia bacterium]